MALTTAIRKDPAAVNYVEKRTLNTVVKRKLLTFAIEHRSVLTAYYKIRQSRMAILTRINGTAADVRNVWKLSDRSGDGKGNGNA